MGRDRADHSGCRPHGRAAESVPAADRAVGRADAEPFPSGRHDARPGCGWRPVPRLEAPPMTPSLNAIVPMACVTAAGIAAMVAEAFRDPGERMPIAGLGVVGLVGAAIAPVLLWTHRPSGFCVFVADDFGLFVTGILIIVGLLSLAVSKTTIDREHLPRGEYY